MRLLLAPLLLAAGLTAQEPYAIGKGVTAPRPVFMKAPDYSEAARRAKLQGRIVFSIVINAEGKVSEVYFLEQHLAGKDTGAASEDDFGLLKNAADTVAQWVFKPGTKEGRPVAVVTNVEVNFRLN